MKHEIHNLFQNIEKFFLTIKKNTSIEEKSCYNISDNLMLKTISYSIVCFSNKIIEMEEAKKTKEPMELKNKDLLFSCVDSQIEIKKIFQKVFNDNNIDVEKQVSFFSSQYISSNNYIVEFATPFSVKISFINKDNQINNEQETNIRKIGKELIKSINDYYNIATNIIAYIETNYFFVIENVKKNISSFSTLKKDNITIPKIELDYNEENGYIIKLKLEQNNNNLVIKAKAKINGSNLDAHDNIKQIIEKEINDLGL